MLRRTLPVLRSVKDGLADDAHFPSLKGHPPARVEAREAAEEERERGRGGRSTVKEFQVYRWNPDSPGRPFLRSYFVDLSACGPMVLDVLQKIKSEQDPTLAFRRSCREGICGSCSMSIDGVNTVACLKPVDADASRATVVTPLPHMFVVKDLVVDLTAFYQQYKSVEPWLKTREPPAAAGREHAQSPAQRKRLDGLYECILCACCSTACPSYWWNSEAFLGPAALLHAYRWVSDTRDGYARERVQALSEGWDKMYRCRLIKSCTATCPKSLDPAAAISAMKALHQGLTDPGIYSACVFMYTRNKKIIYGFVFCSRESRAHVPAQAQDRNAFPPVCISTNGAASILCFYSKKRAFPVQQR